MIPFIIIFTVHRKSEVNQAMEWALITTAPHQVQTLV